MTALHLPRVQSRGGSVEIRYTLGGAPNAVDLDVFDVRGRRIWSALPARRDPGEHLQLWDRRDRSGSPAARGVYFVHLRAGKTSATRKLILLHP